MKINFRERKLPLKDIFQQMELAEGEPNQPLIYTGSIDVKKYFNGLFEENSIENLGRNPGLGFGWASKLAFQFTMIFQII